MTARGEQLALDAFNRLNTENATRARQSDMEVWRPVVGFGPFYDVSSLGRVRRSLTARGYGSRPGHVRRLWISSSTGYAETVIYLPPRRPFRRTVHSLVAESFIGPCPPGMEVLHGDGNRANAALSNLRYGTRSENHLDAYAAGREVRGAAAAGPGTNRPNAKLDDDAVRTIRREYIGGSRHSPGNGSELARRFGVTTAAVRAVANRRSWTHVRDADNE